MAALRSSTTAHLYIGWSPVNNGTSSPVFFLEKQWFGVWLLSVH